VYYISPCSDEISSHIFKLFINSEILNQEFQR